MAESNHPSCSSRRKNGTPCRAAALPGKTGCAFHDPGLAEKRTAAHRQGRQTRSGQRAVLPDAPEVCFADVASVTRFLGETATATRRGTLLPKVASVLAYIAATARRAVQPGQSHLGSAVP